MTYLDELEKIIAPLRNELAKVRLAIFDVDGVLTNGQLCYEAGGESIKIFHVRDGVGLKLLQDMGIAVAVVTAKDSEMVARRVKELGIIHYVPGAKNKLDTVIQLAESLGITKGECCFTGDDMVDLPVMQAVGVSFCPNDAYPYVAERANIQLNVSGGQGVARMVCDMLLLASNQYDAAYQLASTEAFERQR